MKTSKKEFTRIMGLTIKEVKPERKMAIESIIERDIERDMFISELSQKADTKGIILHTMIH